MSSDKFVKYRSFDDRGLATQLYKLLTDSGLTVEWDDSEKQFDVSFVNNEMLNWYYIRLKPSDFKKADEILMQFVQEHYEVPAEDYYLHSFTDAELIDLLQKTDEWSIYDSYWAQKILDKRGISIGDRQIEEMKETRLNELKKPWKLGFLWIFCAVAALVYSIAIPHFLWSTCCMLFGLYLFFSKKTIPDGQRVYAFSSADRKMGLIYSIAAAVITIIILLMYVSVLPFPWYL